MCFGDDNLLKIAELLEEDPVNIIARAHISDDNSHNMRMLWSDILRRLDSAEASNVVEFKGNRTA